MGTNITEKIYTTNFSQFSGRRPMLPNGDWIDTFVVNKGAQLAILGTGAGILQVLRKIFRVQIQFLVVAPFEHVWCQNIGINLFSRECP